MIQEYRNSSRMIYNIPENHEVLRTNVKSGTFLKITYTMNIRKPFLAKNFIFNWWDFMKTYIWMRTIRASKSIFYVYCYDSSIAEISLNEMT